MPFIQLAFSYDPEAPEDEKLVFSDGTEPEEESR